LGAPLDSMALIAILLCCGGSATQASNFAAKPPAQKPSPSRGYHNRHVGHETDISGADHGDAHEKIGPSLEFLKTAQ
jgi:hypothetical protein